jgi:MarC family membrane protein
MTLSSATFLLILVMDPLGNIPLFLTALKNVAPDRKKQVIARELVISLVIFLLFLFLGPQLLMVLHISGPSLSIAGGIILFMIAVKMIFPAKEDDFEHTTAKDPLVFPLAVPLVAGPSALITIMLMISREPTRWKEWFFALILAWLISSTILMASTELEKLLGERGLLAIERLMGMILVAIAVEMALNGVLTFLQLHDLI